MQNEKVEYTACHLLDGKILGSKNRFVAFDSNAGKSRITREGQTITVEELHEPFRIFEIPTSAAILERKAAAKEKGK